MTMWLNFNKYYAHMNLKYHGTSSKVNNDPYAFSPEKKLVLGEQTNFFNKSTACHYQNLL